MEEEKITLEESIGQYRTAVTNFVTCESSEYDKSRITELLKYSVDVVNMSHKRIVELESVVKKLLLVAALLSATAILSVSSLLYNVKMVSKIQESCSVMADCIYQLQVKE